MKSVFLLWDVEQKNNNRTYKQSDLGQEKRTTKSKIEEASWAATSSDWVSESSLNPMVFLCLLKAENNKNNWNGGWEDLYQESSIINFWGFSWLYYI